MVLVNDFQTVLNPLVGKNKNMSNIVSRNVLNPINSVFDSFPVFYEPKDRRRPFFEIRLEPGRECTKFTNILLVVVTDPMNQKRRAKPIVRRAGELNQYNLKIVNFVNPGAGTLVVRCRGITWYSRRIRGRQLENGGMAPKAGQTLEVQKT